MESAIRWQRNIEKSTRKKKNTLKSLRHNSGEKIITIN